MLQMKFNSLNSNIDNILLLGAHCDDIEIGCGASILRLVRQFPVAIWHWIVFSSNSVRELEARNSAESFLNGVVHKRIVINNYRNGFFPFVGAEIKEYFENLKLEVNPDIIFTHYRNDLHQDHRVVSELTSNTFRNHLILEYEIMKYDGDLGRPNFFMPSSDSDANKKIELLINNFASQRDKHWFTHDTFRSLMRLRGVECNSESGLAEAYYSRKMIL